MRNAIIIAAIVGGVLWYRRRSAVALSVPSPEGSQGSAAAFLSGGGSPDVVLGASGGYGPLRSAWG